MNILYIAGYGRSGSSILSRLIGQHPAFMSLGELGRLEEFVRDDRDCTCSLPLSTCPFWGPMLQAPNSSERGASRRGDFWPAEVVRDQPGFLIDSSKTAYRGFFRPVRYLLRGQRVFLIHLVRNPDQVVESTLKGRNKDIEFGKVRRRPMETARTLFGWFFANVFASCYRLLLGRRATLVRYEDLLVDPAVALSRIAELVDEDFAGVVTLLDEARPLERGHEIAGNRVLRADGEAFRRLSERPGRPEGLRWRIFSAVVRPIGGR